MREAPRVDKRLPGPNFVRALLSGRPMKATRPRHFFRTDGPMPAAVELVLKLPDHFEGKDAFLAELRQGITAVEDACARERQQTGRHVVGRRRILRQSWRDCPASRAPRRNLRPRIAARNPDLRVATILRNKAWEAAYADARRQMLAGILAKFPFGTYALRRLSTCA